MLKISLPNDEIKEVPSGTPINEILNEADYADNKYPIIAVLMNNEIESLSTQIEINCKLSPIFLNSPEGARIYRRSLIFATAMASRKCFPNRKLVLSHSLGDGYYYYFEDEKEATDEEITYLTETIKNLAEQNLPIIKKILSYTEAINLFERENLHHTALLLQWRNNNRIPTYSCNEFTDLSHGPLVAHTGVLTKFDIMKYDHGFILRHPSIKEPNIMEGFKDNPILFSVYKEYKNWGKVLNVNSVGKLNGLSNSGEIRHFISVAETLHNKKIAEIADQIFNRKDELKVVLIAGPSSSGKTSFSKKLSIQLQVLGFIPIAVSLDDFFVARDQTPLDEHGKYDFESIDAINIDLLNSCLLSIFKGNTTELPIFDFKTGLPKDKGREMTLPNRGILILEGIHGLNDRLTNQIDHKNKFKIYVSALTQLNLDDNNRISTTDNRLIRRMVRDHKFRGHSALNTLEMWPSVRRGEEKNIFPHQNSADAAFNSALDYELAVLKVYAEPLLKSIKPYHEKYHEARRLQSFLNNFSPIPSNLVPRQSILREFIGDSYFKY